MAVEERKGLGLSWGKRCTVIVLILDIFYLLVSLAYCLTTRLYLKAYYTSAHVAGLGAVVALFVLAHHICHTRSSLGCCLRLFAVTQTVLNILYLLINIVMAVGYIIIAVISIHINFDYTVGAVFSCINIVWMVYLQVTTCAATKRDRYMDYEVDVQFVWHSDSLGGIANDMELFGYPAYGDVGTGKSSSTGTNTSLMKKSSEKKKHKNSCHCSKCASCCRITWNIIFSFFYIITHIILVVIFVLSACHPVFIAADTYQYRNTSDLYTVTLEGHKPLSLFLRCRGKGDETIVYENGLGSLAYMIWYFIPRYLQDKYVVCITDRRGYGWSETYEYDNISLLVDKEQQQWSLTNSELFVKLVTKAEIKTPFYYIGHSYGGHHLVQVAVHHPELIKGLIFLDSAHFGPEDTFKKYAELMSNFDGMGILYILLETGWVDFGSLMEDVVELNALPSDVKQELYASFRSGYYLTSYYRENHALNGEDEFAYQGIERAIIGQIIHAPTFVIDAGKNNANWFPKAHFSNYSESNHYSYVPGASHSMLVASNRYGNLTSVLIDAYIQYDLKHINVTELMVITNDVMTCAGLGQQVIVSSSSSNLQVDRPSGCMSTGK